jgi:hypothetical protein
MYHVVNGASLDRARSRDIQVYVYLAPSANLYRSAPLTLRHLLLLRYYPWHIAFAAPRTTSRDINRHKASDYG